MARRCPLILVAGLLAGCGGPLPSVDELLLDPGQYSAAFDAALDVTRDHGFTPLLRDRRTGRIATESARAGTLLEPWRDPGVATDDRIEHTLSHDRRRVRIEFDPDGSTTSASATTPDPFGLDGGADLTTHAGPVRVRAWVTIERQHAPGLRRDRWTREATTRTTYPGSEAHWTPVRRDAALERRLLAAISAQLARPESSP